MKLGRKLPKVWSPQLDFGRYLTGAAPAPRRPLGERWESKAIHLLHDPAGNDTVGDCTCAAIVKLEAAWSHDSGDMGYAPDMTPLALGLYSRATGYNPADPNTDQGAELSDILTYVKARGVDTAGRGKGLSWVEVDATKATDVMKAIDIFGGLYTGVSLSPDWLNGTVEGSTWGVAAPGDPQDGHCVAVFDYNARGVIANTWGMFITITWGALATYWGKSAGGEVYAVFSPDWLNAQTQMSPSGFNAAQLAADVKALP